LHLLGRQRRRALHELGVLRIEPRERQRIHGDLLLAHRMIRQELRQPRRRQLRPRAGCRMQQRQRREDLREVGRLGGAFLVGSGARHGTDHICSELIEIQVVIA